MNYTQQYHILKQAFDPSKEKVVFPGSDIACTMVNYESIIDTSMLHEHAGFKDHDIGSPEWSDDSILENRSFRYPVFMSENSGKKVNAIILLHGLNERSWVKYLVWAYYLVQHTDRPVILFPIAFHMNRAPEAWGDPRVMLDLLAKRKNRLGEIPLATFANVALSERLSDEPLRFYASGRQSALDLVNLTRQVRLGDHPLFEKGTGVDFFSYSIGAFLAQVLFLGNPDNLYTDSRLFLFCGGALFDEMNGVSKLIMDQPAFGRLREYYLLKFEKEALHSDPLAEAVYHTELGTAFLAMLAEPKLRSFRRKRLEVLGRQVYALTLSNDAVIPAQCVYNNLHPYSKVDVMNLPYAYTHESPFPLLGNDKAFLVDNSFRSIFSKAASFLC